MSANCVVNDIFPIYGRFGAMQKPVSGCIVYRTCIFTNTAFYLTKTENRIKKSVTQLLHYCFE